MWVQKHVGFSLGSQKEQWPTAKSGTESGTRLALIRGSLRVRGRSEEDFRRWYIQRSMAFVAI